MPSLKELKKEIEKDFIRGESVDDLALEYEISREGIEFILEDYIKEQEMKEVVKEFKQGKTRREITGEFDFSYQKVCHIIRQAGMGKARNEPKLDKEERINLLRQYANGMEVKEILRVFDIGLSTLYRYIPDELTRRKGKIKDKEAHTVARRFLIEKKPMNKVVAGLDMSQQSANRYRWKDPIVEADFFREYNYTYDDMRERFYFKDKNNKMLDYWICWRMVHHDEMSMKEVERDTDYSYHFIRTAALIHTSNAFVAVWELAKREDRLPCQ